MFTAHNTQLKPHKYSDTLILPQANRRYTNSGKLTRLALGFFRLEDGPYHRLDAYGL